MTKTRALVFVVEEYKNGSLPSIRGAVASGLKMADWVLKRDKDAQVLLCAPEGVPGRTHPNDAQGLVDALNQLLVDGKNATPELFVYYSGHGCQSKVTPDRVPAPGTPMTGAILIASDYKSGNSAGNYCFSLGEIQSVLYTQLGGSNHFYFVDACRLSVDTRKLTPRTLGISGDIAQIGFPVNFTLFAAMPGAPAANDTRFANALVAGLGGDGRAKTWLGQAYYVTFDSLSGYVAKTLGDGRKVALDVWPTVPPSQDGAPPNGKLVTIDPARVPPCACVINAVGADPDGTLTLKADADHRTPHREKLHGPHGVVTLPPDRYKFTLTQATPSLEFDQTSPDPAEWVELFQDGASVRFEASHLESLPAIDEGAQPLAKLALRVPPGASASFMSRLDGARSSFEAGSHVVSVSPGTYDVSMKQHGATILRRVLRFEPDRAANIDLFADAVPFDARPFLRTLSVGEHGLDVSGAHGPVADPNPAVWFSLFGASTLVGPLGAFPRLHVTARIARTFFAQLRPDELGVYVIVCADAQPALRIHRDHWGTLNPAGALMNGVFHQGIISRSPVDAVGIDLPGRGPVNVATLTLPGCVTLIVVVLRGGGGNAGAGGADRPSAPGGSMSIRQIIISPAHIGDTVPVAAGALEGHLTPLDAVRLIAQAEARFAARLPIEPGGEGIDADAFQRFASLELLDPILTPLLGYDLARRGEAQAQRKRLEALIAALRTAFPGHPDAEALARIAGLRFTPVTRPPLILDGLLVLRGAPGQAPVDEALRADDADLDFHAMWTTGTGPAAEEEAAAALKAPALAVAKRALTPPPLVATARPLAPLAETVVEFEVPQAKKPRGGGNPQAAPVSG